jgi:hypothetical protein
MSNTRSAFPDNVEGGQFNEDLPSREDNPERMVDQNMIIDENVEQGLDNAVENS